MSRTAGKPSAPVSAAHAQAIYEVIRALPRGRVATYGQVAMLAGMPGRARLVARALRFCDPSQALPWHRVMGRKSAGTSCVSIPDRRQASEQRRRLEREGVRFSAAGTVQLSKHGWLPL